MAHTPESEQGIVTGASLEPLRGEEIETGALFVPQTDTTIDSGAVLPAKAENYSGVLPIIGYQNTLSSGASFMGSGATEGVENVISWDTSRRFTSAGSALSFYIRPVNPAICDYIALAGLNLDQTGGTIRVSISYAVGGPLTVIANDLGGDGRSTARLFTFPAQTVADIRIDIVGNGQHTIANVALGQALVMQRSQYSGVTPASLSSSTKRTTTISDSGQFLNCDIQRRGVEYKASFRHITDEWYRASFEPFTRHAQTLPFYYAWNPVEDPSGVIYGVAKSDIIPSKMGVLDWLTVNFDIMGHR
jgi:hypothetical protein